MEGISEGSKGVQSSPFSKPQINLEMPVFGTSSMANPIRKTPDSNNRHGIPPSHPNNHCSMAYPQTFGSKSGFQQLVSQNLNPGPSHSRSLSQPSFFSLDCLSELSPLSFKEPSGSNWIDPVTTNVSIEDRGFGARNLPSPVARSNEFPTTDRLPPRKGHRRSVSDIPLGFLGMIHTSQQSIYLENTEKPIQLVKCESEWCKDAKRSVEGIGERKLEGEIGDDLVSAYMNLDSIGPLSSGATEDKDLDSRASGSISKTNGGESSDNEVESCANVNSISLRGATSSSVSTGKREGIKRTASGDVAPTARHYRSVSMDSYMGSLLFDDESLKVPPSGSQQSPVESGGGSSKKLNLDFAKGEFSQAELKKIMDDEKLTEIALSDPKHAKRILANRQSAARSKERKLRYIAELEHKVQTLQTEAASLSAQLTILQKDLAGLASRNNELKFRLQAIEQQAQLKDALNEALAAEVQRLKLAAAEFSGEAHLSNQMAQQLSLNPQMFHLNFYQQQLLTQQKRQQNQDDESQSNQRIGGDSTMMEPK